MPTIGILNPSGSWFFGILKRLDLDFSECWMSVILNCRDIICVRFVRVGIMSCLDFVCRYFGGSRINLYLLIIIWKSNFDFQVFHSLGFQTMKFRNLFFFFILFMLNDVKKWFKQRFMKLEKVLIIYFIGFIKQTEHFI